MQTSDLNDNNTGSDQDASAIFRQFQDATFSREHTSLKTLTKIRGVYLRKLAPARVSYRDDFLI